MRDVVVENIIEGSRLRSPFLHLSTKFKGAYHFYALGAPRADADRDPRSVIIRLDVRAMIEKGTLTYKNVLNLSNDARQCSVRGLSPKRFTSMTLNANANRFVAT